MAGCMRDERCWHVIRPPPWLTDVEISCLVWGCLGKWPRGCGCANTCSTETSTIMKLWITLFNTCSTETSTIMKLWITLFSLFVLLTYTAKWVWQLKKWPNCGCGSESLNNEWKRLRQMVKCGILYPAHCCSWTWVGAANEVCKKNVHFALI